jgi:ABC-2 type transport system permease protein
VRGCWLQYVALFSWATPIGYLSYKIVLPLAQLTFFFYLGRFGGGARAASFAVLGNALQLIAINAIYGVVQAVAIEREFGTLPILLGSPANRAATFLGRAFVHVLDGTFGVFLALVVAAVLFRVDFTHADLPVLALSVVLIALTTSGLGLAFGSLALIMRDIWVFSNTIYYLLLVLCGINFSLTLLPGWVRAISYSIPLTRGVEAAREAVAGASIGDVSGLLLGEVLVGAAYAAVGYALFRLLERQARRGGLQEVA